MAYISIFANSTRPFRLVTPCLMLTLMHIATSRRRLRLPPASTCWEMMRLQSSCHRRALSAIQTFSRKNELMRHLRHHHTMLWNKSESLAIQLDAQLKPTQHCYCVPAAPQRKHVCLLFIQYALMRIQLGEAPDAAAAALAPPEQLLGTKEIIKQLCWLGLLPLVQFRPMLRLALTLHCQLCNTRFQSSALLMMHLRTETFGCTSSL